MIKDSILVKYFLGESSKEEQQAVEAYRESAPEEFARLQQMWMNREEIKLESFNKQKAWRKIASKTTVQAKGRTRRVVLYRAVAAVFILMLGLSLWLGLNQQSTNWEIYLDTQSPVLLEDGTQVWLNQGARLEAPTKFKGKNRAVRLIGEAFFEVTENPARPFIINNEALEIKVLGTSFNVQAKKVSVATGKVQVQSNASPSNIILEQDEAAILDEASLVATPIDPNFQAWRTGVFSFNNVAIEEVIEALNRYYRQTLSLQSEESDCQVSIEFNQESRVDIIQSLEIICGVDIN